MEDMVLKNRADCVNRVHKFVNTVVPTLMESLKEGFKLTNGYQMYQKDKDRIKDVLLWADGKKILGDGVDGGRGSRAYVASDEYNVKLEVSDNYPIKYHNGGNTGSYTCEYYKVTVYLWNNRDKEELKFNVRELVNYKELIDAKAELVEVEKELSDLTSRRHSLRRKLGR